MPRLKLTPIPFQLTEQQKRKFWEKVDQSPGPDACWPWKASTSNKGTKKERGKVRLNKLYLQSVRVGWLVVHGEDPLPLHVLHTCDNGLCHNPTHWFRGTNHENILDRNRKDRGGRKLNNAAVLAIKIRLRDGEKRATIAASLGVSLPLIDKIAHGDAWVHVLIESTT